MTLGKCTEGAKKQAMIYRAAAATAERTGGDHHLMAYWAMEADRVFGDDYGHAVQREQLRDVFGNEYADQTWSDDERALALCFMAAMVEAGDA